MCVILLQDACKNTKGGSRENRESPWGFGKFVPVLGYRLPSEAVETSLLRVESLLNIILRILLDVRVGVTLSLWDG